MYAVYIMAFASECSCSIQKNKICGVALSTIYKCTAHLLTVPHPQSPVACRLPPAACRQRSTQQIQQQQKSYHEIFGLVAAASF